MSGAMPGESATEEPATQEPVGVEPTAVPIAQPTATPLPTRPAPSPTPIVVEAASEAPADKVLGRLEVEYPVMMAPQSSDTVILELSIPELLVAAEPAAVVRVEEAEPVAEGLGRYEAVVYLVDRMRAELTSPALVVEPVTSPEQDVDTIDVASPTTWAWTVQAPETAGKQVMTLRLFRAGEETPLWVGSLRVDIAAGEAAQAPAEMAAEEPAAPGAEAPPATEASGLFARIVQALTQDVTGLMLGILGLIGTIVAAVLAAWVQRGGGRTRRRGRRLRSTRSRRQAPKDVGRDDGLPDGD